jgi:hypothetical protein
MKNKIIISQPWGGLGDNLQLSTIPEIAKSLGYEVYVSNQNTNRSEDIKHLVWEMNPFIDGFVDEPGTIDWNSYKNIYNQVIKDVEMMVFGSVHSDGNPKLYLPDHLKEKVEYFKGRTIIDPNAVSADGAVDFEKLYCNYSNPILLNTEHEQYETYQTKNIINWVMAINSCKKFVCANSGGSVVATALGKRADVWVNPNIGITHYKFKHNYLYL